MSALCIFPADRRTGVEKVASTVPAATEANERKLITIPISRQAVTFNNLQTDRLAAVIIHIILDHHHTQNVSLRQELSSGFARRCRSIDENDKNLSFCFLMTMI
jgi:hypothetical protein